MFDWQKTFCNWLGSTVIFLLFSTHLNYLLLHHYKWWAISFQLYLDNLLEPTLSPSRKSEGENTFEEKQNTFSGHSVNTPMAMTSQTIKGLHFTFPHLSQREERSGNYCVHWLSFVITSSPWLRVQKWNCAITSTFHGKLPHAHTNV